MIVGKPRFGRESFFSKGLRSVSFPTQHHILWVNQTEREADHSHLLNVKVKMCAAFPPIANKVLKNAAYKNTETALPIYFRLYKGGRLSKA